MICKSQKKNCRLLLGATFGANERNAPAKMNDVEPEFFGWSGARAKPRFKVFIRSLPVLPNSGAGFDGAAVGAEVINIKWLWGIGDFAFSVF